MVAMLVLGHVEAFDMAVTRARRHHGDLALERHESLEDRWLRADLRPRGCMIDAVPDRDLALAVVAEPPRLQHGRTADLVERRGERGRRIDVDEPCGCDAEPLHEAFLDQAILR